MVLNEEVGTNEASESALIVSQDTLDMTTHVQRVGSVNGFLLDGLSPGDWYCIHGLNLRNVA